jgi:phage gp29-like protein
MSIATRLQSVLEWLGFQFQAQPRTSLFSEQAVDQVLSFLTQAADPDEILVKAGISRARLRALSGDDEIAAAMDTRREAILAMPWRLEVDGKSEADIPEPVEWIWEQFEKHAEKVLRASMESLAYGYSVQEVVYANGGERITWGQITEKPFEWFIPKLDGSVLYKSRQRPLGEPVDSRKFFLTVRNQTYRQPYGEALYSRLYWPWYFRQQGWRFWVRWLERFGTPLLIGKAQGDAKTMAEQLAQVANNAVIAVGASDEILLAENKSGAGHFEGFERAICARIQKVVLGQTLTSDSGGSSGTSGSYALGQVHNEVRRDRRDADVRMVRTTVQRMIDVLWALNRFDGAPPVFVMADDTGLELERAERDARLVQAGVVKLTPDYLLRVYDYEPEDIDTEAMTSPRDPAPEAQPQGGAFHVKASALFAAPRFTRKQQAIEDGVDAVLGNLGDAIEDAEIKGAIRAAASRDELVDNLTALLAHVPGAQFRATLERALFAADILGYAHATTTKE